MVGNERRIPMSTNIKRERPAVARSDRDHLEKLLDQALADSFPASDPVAVNFEAPAMRDTGEERDDDP
jgi:hypothetical protein